MEACGPGGGSMAGTGSFLPGHGDTPACPFCCWSYRGAGCQEGERSLRAPVAAVVGSSLLQCLQMCTNKGGLKQNKSKQTNGIRVMGVGGLVHSDKHNDSLCV